MFGWLTKKKKTPKGTPVVKIYYWASGGFEVISAKPINFKGTKEFLGKIIDRGVVFPEVVFSESLPHAHGRKRFHLCGTPQSTAEEIAFTLLQEAHREANDETRRMHERKS